MADGKEESSDKRTSGITWTTDDIKLLIVTVVATVIANVITVVLVALAVIVARSFRPNEASPADYAFLWGSSIIPALAAYIAFEYWRSTRRHRASGLSRNVSKWIIIIVGAFEGFFLLLYILAAIGYAVGVK
jgi:hypothetical protein